MIPTTLGMLVQAEPALGRLLEQRVPMRTAYHLSKFAKLVRAETLVYHEQRDALIRELGASREPTDAERAKGIQGPVTEVTPANLAAFVAKVQELAAVPVTLAWAPLAPSALADVAISGADLLALEPLLTEPSEPTP